MRILNLLNKKIIKYYIYNAHVIYNMRVEVEFASAYMHAHVFVPIGRLRHHALRG